MTHCPGMGPSHDEAEGDNHKTPSQSVVMKTMRRELSVEDLFAPLNELDMRPSSETKENSTRSVHLTDPSSSSYVVGVVDHMSSIAEESGLGTSTNPNQADAEEYNVKLGFSNSKDRPRSAKTTSSSRSGSTSDDDQQDQHVLDDRKQRRMLSNRESARRSRLRKQQHLDELRAHVAQLRAQHSQMLSRFNLASQHFDQISEENQQLRSEAMDLSHQLQRLHHTMVSRRASMSNTNGFRYESSHVVQGP